jgi:hypothetical protein
VGDKLLNVTSPYRNIFYMGCKLTNTSWVSMVTLTIAIHAVINNTTVPEGNISLEKTSKRDKPLQLRRY